MNLRGEDGQSLIFVTIALVIILGMLGLVLDTGKVYIAQRHLQTATDAAALAAAQDLPDATTASLTACKFSATDGTVSGDSCAGDAPGNNTAGLNGVSTHVQPECLSVQTTGINCIVSPSCDAGTPMPPDGNVGCNAIQVTETVKVNPWLLGILGIGAQTVSSTSTASMAGGGTTPLDIEMIDDTTESMQCPLADDNICGNRTPDPTQTCGGTPTDVPANVDLSQEDCAKAGIRALLTNLDPCVAALANCDPQTLADPTGQLPLGDQLDDVGLVSFPGLNTKNLAMTGNAVSNELDCQSEFGRTDVTYGTNAQFNGATFQIVPFSSDYRYSNQATRDPLATLYPKSHLVQAVYWAGDNCPNGGYPTPTGGGGQATTSISGGKPITDSTVATSNTSSVGSGIATATSMVNSGIVQGKDIEGTAVAGIGVGNPQSAATAAQTIGGGTTGTGNFRNGNAAGVTKIGIAPPANTGAGDFVTVTVTAQDPAIVAASSICAPDGTWLPNPDNTIVNLGVAGTTPVMQATFYGLRSALGDPNGNPQQWHFGFFPGACPGTLPGTPTLNVDAASIVAVRYTNVAGVDAIANPPNMGGPVTTTVNGSAPSTTVWAGTTNLGTTFTSKTWSSTHYISLATANCFATDTTTCNDAAAAASGNVTSITFTLGATPARNTTYTATLVVNKTAVPALSCSITRTTNPPSCTIAGTVPVNAGDKLELQVAETGGGTVLSTTASDAATTSAGPMYVALSSPPACASSNVGTCNFTTVPAQGTLTSVGLTFGSNVPAGDTFRVELFQNGADAGTGCNVTQNTKTCTWAPNVAIAGGDTLELLVSRSNGNAAFTATAATSTTATEVTGGTSLTAPAVTTTSPADDVVRFFGTGSTFPNGTGSAIGTGSGTSTFVDDTFGGSGTEPATTTGPDNWIAETMALKPAIGPLTLTGLPSGYVGGGTNTNLLLATVAVQALPGADVICAPGWTPVRTQQSGPNAGSGPGTTVSSPDATGVTQEGFWTMSASASVGLTFSFGTSCNGAGGSAANPVQLGASVVVRNYTGVDRTAPIDTISTQSSPQAKAGVSSSPFALPVTTSSPGEQVVGLYATEATSIAVNGTGVTNEPGSFTSSGENSQVQLPPGASTPLGASTPTSQPWTSETVALHPSLPSTITVTYPSDYTGATGQVLLLSIAAQGLPNDGKAGICTSAASWNLLGSKTQGSGPSTITQSVWWTTLNTATSAMFSFNANVDQLGGCNGSSLTAGASWVANTYTGVSLGTPFVFSQIGALGTTLTAPLAQTTTTNNEIASFFATNDDFNSPPASLKHNLHSVWTNSGEDTLLQPQIGNQTPLQQKAETTANSANWGAATVAMTPLIGSSVTVTPPPGYVAGGTDLMLVTIAAQGLGTATICAPDASWNPIPVSLLPTPKYTTTSGTLTQETFWTTTSTATSQIFTFNTGNTCNGIAVSAAASAVAVVYTGIDPANPIDTGKATAAGGAASPLQAGPITPSAAGDEMVALYGVNGATFGGVTAFSTGGDTTSGVNDALDGAATAYTPPSVTSNPTTANWTAETVALRPLGNHGITIARPPTPTNNDFILVDVTANGLAANANICAPNDVNSPWTEEGVPVTQGSITQALFYSLRTSLTSESYTFTFRTGACPAGGAATGATATAIAVRYTGVNPVQPIDDNINGDIYGSTPGTKACPVPATCHSSPVVPPANLTAAHTGDAFVAFYGAAAKTITINAGTGRTAQALGTLPTSTLTAFWDNGTTVSTLNPTVPPTGALSSASDWVGQSVALQAAASSCGSCVYGTEAPDDPALYTNYGIAINQAEAALDGLAGTRPAAQKVIILLSDGDANINPNNVSQYPCQYGIQQAELAEANAGANTSQGNTWFFSVAYGANYDQSGRLTPKSCTLDTGGPLQNLSAQCAMQLMADNHVTDPAFKSDPTDVLAKNTICGNNAVEPSDPAHRFYSQAVNGSLEDIFTQIAEQATQPRLISNGAT